jgi:hypothetical protein
MKKIFTGASTFLFGLLLFSSCSKTDLTNSSPAEESVQANAKPPAETSTIRVKTKSMGNDIRTYTYDASGRSLGSTSIVFNSIVYEYPDASHINYTLKYPGGTIASLVVFDLNNKGLVAKANASTLQGFYTYNNKKQLIKHEVNFDNGDVAVGTFTYAGGNLDKVVSVYNGALSWSKTFSYYGNLDNVLGNEEIGESFLGADNKNLLKSSVFTIAGGSTTTENYSYEFDAQGRVSKTMTVKNGVAQPDIIYTYY